MTPMQTLTAAIQAGHRPSATDTMQMLYELGAAFGDWPESRWMPTGPEDWADSIVDAQKCIVVPPGELFELPAFPSIRRAA